MPLAATATASWASAKVRPSSLELTHRRNLARSLPRPCRCTQCADLPKSSNRLKLDPSCYRDLRMGWTNSWREESSVFSHGVDDSVTLRAPELGFFAKNCRNSDR
eukprot:4051777-Pleurochrysis_carterae.AAC.1